MTEKAFASFSRIDKALARIEAVAAASSATPAGSDPMADARYEKLRLRTQAALAQLDAVIGRVAQSEAR